MAEKRKRSTSQGILSLLGWVFGIGFFLPAIAAYFYANLPGAISGLLMGLLICPYTYWKFVDPYVQLGLWGRVGSAFVISILVLAIASALIPGVCRKSFICHINILYDK